MTDVMDRNSVPIATPAKASFTGVNPPFENDPIIKISPTARPAPIKEDNVIPVPEIPGTNAITRTRANAAPSVTPITEGDAKGFLVIPCIMAPDTAKKAPTNAAEKARGKRSS